MVPFVDHDGARLHYHVEGKGPPLLLIMGLGYPSDVWWRVLPWLTAIRTTIRFDNRGVGLTGMAEEPYSVERMAEDAVAVLDAAGFAEADVWGVSMGGTVAQEVVLRHPARVQRLILGCTHPGAADFVIDADALRMLSERSGMSPEEAAAAAIPFVYSATTAPQDIEADIAVRMRMPTSPEGYAAQLAGTRTWAGSAGRLHEIQAPTLVIHGTADRLVPVANGRFLAERIPGSLLVELDGASHIFWTDRPEETRRAMEDFLRSRTSAEWDGSLS